MEITEAHGDSLGLEVIIPEAGKAVPCCPHGPALLFEKLSKGGEAPRRFYACSACRDRKDCNFFQWEDEKVSEERLKARKAENQLKRVGFTQQQQQCNRFVKFASLALHEKRFCQDCQLLLLPAEHGAHTAHRCAAVTTAQLKRPSMLLRPLENKKSYAQYLFAERSAGFLLDTITALGYNKVLCVGTPRLHEFIKLRNLEQKQPLIKSLLLDIDFRYAQFYKPEEFCHYNMFNHHFFNGESSSAVLQAFLSQSQEERVVMVADPPFGGLVKPLAHSFTLMSQTWRKLQSCDGDADMPMIWIFPYFFEPRILECFPSFAMLDYQVDYDNHPLYKHGKTGRKQSPVRLFTNLSAKDFILPKDEGYRLCSVCERYVWSLNKHCIKCNLCPSKDGREWKHCSLCDKCVKPSWKHCTTCERCCLPEHPCSQGEVKQGCFTCGSLKHKHRVCPLRTQSSRQIKAKPGMRKTASPAVLKQKTKRKSGAARRAKKAAAAAQSHSLTV